MLVFAVESSCDETSVCLMNSDKAILSHIIYSQKIHSMHGGVVPELASRAHLEILQKITNESLFEAKVNPSEIDVFTSTCGPGLIGSLLVGSIFTKAMSIGVEKPFYFEENRDKFEKFLDKIIHVKVEDTPDKFYDILEIANPVTFDQEEVHKIHKFIKE